MVRARRRGDTLTLSPLVPAGAKGELVRAELLKLAQDTLTALTRGVGHSREQVDAALSGLVVRAALKKVSVGLAKLALDACEFSADAGDDARALRAELFTEAAAARMAATSQQDFSVAQLKAAAAARQGCSVEDLSARLYADLRGQHVLLSGPPMSAHHLLDAYELGQAQAVLLRATEVRVVVSDPHAPTLRYLFRKLKFHGLLHEITPLSDSAATGPPTATRYAITLSGPLSLFQASTKYGLALALTLPALRACASFELEADVLWGPNRDRLRFTLSGGRDAQRAAGPAPASEPSDGDAPAALGSEPGPQSGAPTAPAGRPEVEALVASFDKLDGPWRATHAGEILNVPGLGVCVPDVTFTHRDTKQVVHLEVLGFWSRDAVFRRVELIEAGLDAPMIVAVPARLRVSEEVLDDDLPGSLYVFKSVLSRKAVLARLEALSGAR
jgi:hypothetical protein